MEEDWHRISDLNIKESPNINYYICIKETILCRIRGRCNVNIEKGFPGMLAEAVGSEGKDSLRVRLHSKTEDEVWHKTEWKCHQIDVLPISELIWRLLCSIPSLQTRVMLVKDEKLCKDVENLKPNSKVWYCPGSPGPLKTYPANVKFIGPVPELGDGYYFGLDLLENRHICKPSLLTAKYFKMFNSPGTFATLSSITPRNTKAFEDIEIFEKNFLCNDNILQSSKTDNFFVNKNKELQLDYKRNTNISQKEKCSVLVDADNNNGMINSKKIHLPNIVTDTVKSISYEQQNDNKNLYRKILKNFDPLNSDDELDEASSNIQIQHTSNANDLSVGSFVKVLVDNDLHYGVIRWIGSPGGGKPDKLMAAIELDNVHPLATDGTYENVKYFECGPQKAWFTDLKDCHQYDMAASSCYYSQQPEDFESIQSSVISGVPIPPISVNGDLKEICGRYRGIQGHHNSCYLDATLFSMFAFTCVFDNLLVRPPCEKDCPEYKEVQRVLREEIVNPLRRNLFVRADHVMKLRMLLEKSSSVSGLTSEEKDPEEFLTSLVAQTLNADPFLQLSSGQSAYHYQLFVEKDDRLTLPTVQQLLEQSFLTSNIKLKELPSCLILQMPRFGKSYKMYPRIQPTLLLDVTDIIEDSPRQCTVCGKLAKFECKECYGQCGEGLQSTAFCRECLNKAHSHEKRINHKPKSLSIPANYEVLIQDHSEVPRLYLELLAVVCIETSHYVSFVKCASGPDAPWCFFDSMADRIGEQDGYNVPEMVPCPDFPQWLSDEGANYIATLTDDRLLPEYAKRLLCDAYMCMYQSPEVMFYK